VEVAASGDVNMASADVHMGPACGEVTSTEVTAGKVTAAPTKVTTAVTAAAVSATSMTASATASKGSCRDYRTTQKDGADSYEQYFSQHQYLHHAVFRAPSLTAAVFRSSTRSSGRCASTTSCGRYDEEIEGERCKRN
jgi:hypothetical protein